jgi:hypothetical protein
LNVRYFLIPLLALAVIGIHDSFGAFSVINSSQEGKIDNFDEGGSCVNEQGFYATPYSFSGSLFESRVSDKVGGGKICFVGVTEFDLSVIPSRSIVTNVDLIIDTNEASSFTGDCDIYHVTERLATGNVTTMWYDVAHVDDTSLGITAPTPLVDDDLFCTSTGTGKIIPLGDTAKTQVENERDGDGFIGLGISGLEHSDTHVVEFSNSQLNVTYFIPNDPPRQFYGQGFDWYGLDMNWLEGDDSSYPDTFSTYEIEVWNGISWVHETNSTSLNYLDTSLEQTDSHKYRISEVGENDIRSCYNYLLDNSLQQDLIAHYSMCDTLNDSGLLDNPFTTWNTTSGNVTGEFVDFGNTRWLNLNNTDTTEWATSTLKTNFTSTDPFSVAFWYKQKAGNWNAWLLTDMDKNGGQYRGWSFNTGYSDKITFTIESDGGNDGEISSFGISENNAHFITGTFDGSNDEGGMNLYINGTLNVAGIPAVIGGTSSSSGNTLELCAFNNGTELCNHGFYIKDIMIFNSTLSPTQVQEVYDMSYANTFAPFELTNLQAQVADFDTVGLTFTSEPDSWSDSECYNINYTTPLGDPQTVLYDCGAKFGSINIDSLDTINNAYSFRMSIENSAGENFTNIANTSSFNNTFTIGDLYIQPETNPITIPIRFVQHDTNSTQKTVQVFYDTGYDLACDVSYKFANTDQTYTDLTKTTQGSEVYTNFTFNDPDNEIIEMYCYNQNDNSTNGDWLISQSNSIVPLVDQVNNFQAGLYGTEGKFGVLDFMTLLVVIVSMIGFNRYNPVVGVVTLVMTMGALSWFGIIQWESTFMGAIALMIVLAIIQVRKT